MAREIQEAVGLMVETRRRIEAMKLRAQRLSDRRSMIALGVALGGIDEAHEALINSQLPSISGLELQGVR
jgi:hypothetical protein